MSFLQSVAHIFYKCIKILSLFNNQLDYHFLVMFVTFIYGQISTQIFNSWEANQRSMQKFDKYWNEKRQAVKAVSAYAKENNNKVCDTKFVMFSEWANKGITL